MAWPSHFMHHLPAIWRLSDTIAKNCLHALPKKHVGSSLAHSLRTVYEIEPVQAYAHAGLCSVTRPQL